MSKKILSNDELGELVSARYQSQPGSKERKAIDDDLRAALKPLYEAEKKNAEAARQEWPHESVDAAVEDRMVAMFGADL